MSTNDSVLEEVRSQYSATAQLGLSSDNAGVRAVAEAFGYTAEELASIPAEANMGLSCGNPTATARLRPGEVAVDLGCGGGLDVMLAAQKVGPEGRAIGIDMSEEMIELARRNAAKGAGGSPVENVEFHHSTIDSLPLDDATVDCILSNCVINLAPDKAAVFREMHRVLKPGGRLAVSDIALKRPLPDDLAENIAAYVGCIAGAITVEEYQASLTNAGFGAVEIIDTGADLGAYAKAEGAAACCSAPAPDASSLPIVDAIDTQGGCCGTSADGGVHAQLADLLRRYDINDFAASVRVFALKKE